MKINIHSHIHNHLCEFVNNTCVQSAKTDSTIISKTEQPNILFKGRSSYDSSLIFIKSFLYLIDLPLFIALICFLI